MDKIISMTNEAATGSPNWHIVENSDSVMDILAAQCCDLETLLALARKETEAVENQDFAELVRVVDARATLGERLEVYHRQISALRTSFGPEMSAHDNGRTSARTRQIVAQIQEQDALTLPLLKASSRDVSESLNDLGRKQQRAGAYLKEPASISVACDRRA